MSSVFGFDSSKQGSRPSTAGTRPGTAGLSRPGTSSGRMSLAQFNSTSNLAPDIGTESRESIIGREIGNDGLLRIMTSDRLLITNQVMLYAEKGDLTNLQKLHKSGIDITSCKGLNGFTPLHHACNRGHALVAAELLRLNASIDSKNDSGETPLHLAVYAGNILTVDQLLDFGANINAINNEGETCLFYAARKAQPAIIRLLLQHGADADIVDKYDERAVDQAADASTIRAFQGHVVTTDTSTHSLHYNDLLKVFSYLNVTDTLRCACVCSKWHRVTAYEEIWQRLGVRRWELALQSSLGFAPSATMSFYRPARKSSKELSAKEVPSKEVRASSASGKVSSSSTGSGGNSSNKLRTGGGGGSIVVASSNSAYF